MHGHECHWRRADRRRRSFARREPEIGRVASEHAAGTARNTGKCRYIADGTTDVSGQQADANCIAIRRPAFAFPRPGHARI
jgi:hypothetical protein